MRARAAHAAARAALEGWRPPVQAALQPVLLLDEELLLVAASQAATRLLRLPALGLPLREALCFDGLVDDDWEALPCVRALRSGRPQRGEVHATGVDGPLDVLASPLFGTAGPIGVTVFLSSG